MRNRKGALAATGLLCAIAATMAVWSGPLTAASGALHTSATVQTRAPGHPHPPAGTRTGG